MRSRKTSSSFLSSLSPALPPYSWFTSLSSSLIQCNPSRKTSFSKASSTRSHNTLLIEFFKNIHITNSEFFRFLYICKGKYKGICKSTNKYIHLYLYRIPENYNTLIKQLREGKSLYNISSFYCILPPWDFIHYIPSFAPDSPWDISISSSAFRRAIFYFDSFRYVVTYLSRFIVCLIEVIGWDILNVVSYNLVMSIMLKSILEAYFI